MRLKTKIQGLVASSPLLFFVKNYLGLVPLLLSSKAGLINRSFSQHGEDVKIASYFDQSDKDGFYVDVGSNHPSKLSNTYKLYLSGMRGICIDPNQTLLDLHAILRPDDILIPAAIGSGFAIGKFYEMSYHALSTFSEDEANLMVDQGQTIIRETFKPILPLSLVLASCFEDFKGKFNFLSIDAEGWDEVVLRSNDWVKFRPKLILVERNNDVVASDIDAYLVSNNYTLLHAEACNALYEDKLKS
jgi:hypothetical protein